VGSSFKSKVAGFAKFKSGLEVTLFILKYINGLAAENFCLLVVLWQFLNYGYVIDLYCLSDFLATGF
jgi:hypothetical protein